MRVIRVKLRTPGIYIKSPAVLEFQVKPAGTGDENYKPVEEETGIKVLANANHPDDNGKGVFSGELEVQEVNVPYQDGGEKIYDLLIDDYQSWEYRILAHKCFDCVQIFKDKVVDISDWTVEVGHGTIN